MKAGEFNNIRNCAIDVVKNFEEGNYKNHRIVTKVWRLMLLNNMDIIKTHTGMFQLRGKSIGAGVWEISLAEAK